jgi:putative ABC transport system permease protein
MWGAERVDVPAAPVKVPPRPTLVVPARRRERPSGLRVALRARWDDFRLSTGALAAHPLRSTLTLLGIVIGVFTVVGMMALTTGLRNSINKGIGALGANTFQMTKWPVFHFGPLDSSVWKRKNITSQQAVSLRDALPQALQLGPEAWTSGRDAKSRFGRAQPVTVAGGWPEIFTNYGYGIAQGRAFAEADLASGARVVVLGANVADACFPGGNPIGEAVQIGRLRLEVVGVIERQGGSPFGFTPDTLAIVPLSVFVDGYGGGRSLDITVMARSAQEVTRTQDAAIAAFRRIRGLQAWDDNDFEVFSNESLRSTVDDLVGKAELFAIGVCALALLVGGIGIMNIMLVAVAERTQEIGVRKSLGARRLRILLQFVIEAVLLSATGGLLGILLGFFAAWLASFAFGIPAEVQLWSVALGLGVSSAIGLVFGIYPAARAARLDPAVALRSE